jgi:hypothetical protein
LIDGWDWIFHIAVLVLTVATALLVLCMLGAFIYVAYFLAAGLDPIGLGG